MLSFLKEIHLTIIKSFRGLFDDLEGNLKQHMQDFQTKVDASESAKMESNYLKEVQEDIKEVYEDLESQEEIIAETIKDVSDITTADVPKFSEVSDAKDEAIEKTEEVEEDLESFNGTSDENDVEAILSQIESVMEKAQTSKGTARFSDFKGASDIKDLEKLQGYNEDKKVEEEKEKEKELEEAKDAQESALKDQNKHSSRDVINKAYEEYKNDDIDYDQYTTILDSVQKTSGNMGEEKMKENTTESFIKYLKDRDMLEDYLEDHEPWLEYVVDNSPEMLSSFGAGTISIFAKKIGV